MKHFDLEETRKYLDFKKLIEALKQMFIEGCIVPPRQVLSIPQGEGKLPGTSLIMPAYRENKKYGVKVVNVFPENTKNFGLPGLHASYNLFNASTGEPLCSIDGIELTTRRTAAASALAASYLSKPDSTKYLIVGSGRVASLMPEAMLAVRSGIQEIRIWNKSPKSAEVLVKSLQNKGFVCKLSESLELDVKWADIISCATLSTEPLVKGEWLQPGAHLDLIGSFTPGMTETDPECFSKSRVFMDTEEACVKSGDILNALKGGSFTKEMIQGTLETMCKGTAKRNSPLEITLFKSVGVASEDLAGAELIYDSSIGVVKIFALAF